MDCPVCKTEMERGLTDRGFWYKTDTDPLPISSIDQIVVDAWRCPECGKIELDSLVD